MKLGFFTAVFTIFLAISTTDVQGRRISLRIRSVGRESPCQSGLIHGEDYFKVTGRIATENFTTENMNTSDSQRVQFILLGTNIEATVCTVFLESCYEQSSSSASSSCYCEDMGDGVYDAIVRMKANVLYSGAQIKLDYKSGALGIGIASSEWTVPETYYKNTEELKLEANGIEVDLTSSQCTLPLREDKNTFKYCCSNAPSCVVKIAEPDGGESHSTGCHTLTYGIRESEPYVFSHSVCGVESSQSYICTGKLSPELFPTEPPAPLDTDEDDDTLHPGIIVAIVIAVVAVLVIGIFLFVKLVWKRRSNAAVNSTGHQL